MADVAFLALTVVFFSTVALLARRAGPLMSGLDVAGLVVAGALLVYLVVQLLRSDKVR